jgi:hypothetical protein
MTLQAGTHPVNSGSRRGCARTVPTFGVLADAVNADPALKPSDKCVLLALYRFGRFKGECFPAVATLASSAGVSDRTVRRCLGRLQEAGYISTRPTADNPTGRVIQCLWLADPKRHPVRRTEGQEALSRTSSPGAVSRTGGPTNPSGKNPEKKEAGRGERQETPAPAQTPPGPARTAVAALARKLGAAAQPPRRPSSTLPAAGAAFLPSTPGVRGATGTAAAFSPLPRRSRDEELQRFRAWVAHQADQTDISRGGYGGGTQGDVERTSGCMRQTS